MMRRGRGSLGVWMVLAALGLPAGVSDAGPRLADVRGHLAFGFGHVFSSDTAATPAGSLSVGAGLDIPLRGGLRGGFDVGYQLLGSRRLVQGSLTAGLDFSLFEALALLHWSPGGGGSRLVLSGGPGLFVARATLAASAIGAAFSGQAIEETRPGGALGLTVSGRRSSPVRLGLEAGVRVVPLESTTWTVVSGRVAILY